MLSYPAKQRLLLGTAFLPLGLSLVVWGRNLITEDSSKWFNPGLDLVGGLSAEFKADWKTPTSAARQWTHEQILQACREILLNRLEAKGIEGAEIRVAPTESSLHVDIPNLENPEALFELIGRTGKLEFRPVLQERDAGASAPGPLDQTEDDYTFRGRRSGIRLGPAVFSGDQLDLRKLRIISPEPGATGDEASYRIAFGFYSDVDPQWNDYAAHHKGERLAITLDRDIRLVPTIGEAGAGTGGDWVLTGHYSLEEARDNFLLLKHGQLPLNLNQVQVNVVGASLGTSFQDEAYRGFAWASAALLLTVLLFYGNRPWLLFTGLTALAAFALTLSAAISFWKFRLTVVAIGGFILTLGMGIDSTVIILESIRESLHRIGGRPLDDRNQEKLVLTSYKEKFERPILIHATVTNILGVTILLFSLPLRPFALVMMLGMVISAIHILLTRGLLLLTRRTYASVLPIFPNWKFKGFDYATWQRFGITFCALAALTGVFFLLTARTSWRRLTLGSDFLPGTEMLVRVPALLDTKDLILAATNRVPGEWKAQVIKSPNEEETGSLVTYRMQTSSTRLGILRSNSQVPNSSNESQDTVSLLHKDFDQLSAKVGGTAEIVNVTQVGPAVATERLRMMVIFVSISLIVVVLYLVWRITIGRYCALGLFLASLHDVLVMLAVLALTGYRISYSVVGGILAIVGYSLNDSIILLVRVRQVRDDTKLRGAKSPIEIVSSAIKETFGRTMATSLATAVPMIVLFFTGGEALRGFSLTVAAGVVAGTLSSYFVVAPFTLRDFAVPQRVEATITAQELDQALDRR